LFVGLEVGRPASITLAGGSPGDPEDHLATFRHQRSEPLGLCVPVCTSKFLRATDSERRVMLRLNHMATSSSADTVTDDWVADLVARCLTESEKRWRNA
jgi:hypothetical protein